MIQAVGIFKSFGARPLFEDVSFSLNRGERAALVGRNGSGKSTLFRLILGDEHPDSGRISAPRHYRLGHLAQQLSFSEPTVLQETCRGLVQHDSPQEYKAKIVLSGLGFSQADMALPPQRFSGGFQIRVDLARVLLSEPNLLLLDEPTNYLDIVSLRWLERFLRSWPNECIIISHDRAFLDAVCTHTMIIHRRKLRKIEGDTEKLYRQLEQEDMVYRQTKQNLDAQRRHMESFVERFRAKASKASMVQSRIKALDRLGTLSDLESEEQLDFSFREAPFPGKVLLETKQLSFSYQPGGQRLIDDFSITIGKGDRIAVIGKNGRGKTTLLRLFAGELAPGAGTLSVSPNACAGYFGQTNIQRLSPGLTVADEVFSANQALSNTAVRNICGTMMFSGTDALKQVRVLSGGEKSRVLLGKLIARPSNLLLLDEPNNHLDLQSVDSLMESLEAYAGAIIIVTHNERLLRALATRLVVFQDDGIQLFEGDYDYFLEKRGWDDEEGEFPTPSRALPAGERERPVRGDREERRARARERQARSDAFKPLEKEVKRLEDLICKLEREVQTLETGLVQASHDQDAARITGLSKSLAVSRAEIDRRFDELSEAVAALEKAQKEFERREDPRS